MSLTRYATTGEAKMAGRVVGALLRAGYTLRVHDGCSWCTGWVKDRDAVLGALASTGEDRVHARDDLGNETEGWVWFVYGNDPSGEELIADYTVSLDGVVLPFIS